MIKKNDLPLVEAMNSIELFAPKMDTGMAAESSTSGRSPSGKSSNREDEPSLFDPARQFRPEEFLWIMDEMLAAEVSPRLVQRH
jgi:hypothetical protein